jgi:hypothetical protein
VLAKRARAQTHFDAVEQSIRSFLDGEPYPIVIEASPHDGRYVFKLHEPRPLPAQEFALGIGDCIHNLRSALDFIAWELAGADPHDRDTMFPIFDDAQQFRRHGAWRIKNIPAMARALIERMQPHKAPHPRETALWAIEHFDTADKHRLLTLTVPVASSIWVTYAGSQRTNVSLVYPTPYATLEHDTIIAVFSRESFETGYVLKQILSCGVRIWCYLEGKELTLNNSSDKMLLAMTSVIADMERERARQRTRDAHLSKALKGHVTGGTVFGFSNVEKVERQQRQHVERAINPAEARTVLRVFNMAADGKGFKRIAKQLNHEGLPSPRPRRDGRSRSWTASSIRALLLNPLYRGLIVWGRTKKRDAWGLKKYQGQPETDWGKVQADHLRIISDDLWNAVQKRIALKRSTYSRNSGGGQGGRPAGGVESPYLLTGFAQCAVCGGTMVVGSRDFKTHRKPVYVCGYHRERGNAICTNRLSMTMQAADTAILEAIERDLMRPEVIQEAVRQALELLEPTSSGADERRTSLGAELSAVEEELSRYAEAIAKAGPLDSLLAELKRRENRRENLKSELKLIAGETKVASLDTARIIHDLQERLTDWQGLLRRETPIARQILREVLVGRVTFTPRCNRNSRYYEFAGQASLSGMLAGVLTTEGMVTPAGFEPVGAVQLRGIIRVA